MECVGEMTAEIERMRGNAWLLCTSQQKPTTLQKATTVTKSKDVTQTAHVQYIQYLLHHHPKYSNNLTCTWKNALLHSLSSLCKWCRFHRGFFVSYPVQLLPLSVGIGQDPQRHVLSITFRGGEV